MILDLHAAPGAQNCEEMGDSPDGIAHLWTEPALYRQPTIDLWQSIAEHYRDEPAIGGYDIATLRDFYVDVTAAIRAVDPRPRLPQVLGRQHRGGHRALPAIDGEDETPGWSGAMIALLEQHDIGWNMWTYKKVENSANYYSIPAPTGWPAMKAYLEGGAAPPRDQAAAIMLELAANASTSSCTLQTEWLEQTFGR